jgi:hypothetical protein
MIKEIIRRWVELSTKDTLVAVAVIAFSLYVVCGAFFGDGR